MGPPLNVQFSAMFDQKNKEIQYNGHNRNTVCTSPSTIRRDSEYNDTASGTGSHGAAESEPDSEVPLAVSH